MKKAVKYSRIAVLVILLVSAVGLAVFVYRYTNSSELDQFEKQFEEDARKVLEHVGTELDFTLGASDAFLVEEITSAQQTNQSWPFVTNPSFAVRAAKLRSLTKALVVITYPAVTDVNREQWEAYSVQNDGWVEEGLRVQENDANFQGTTVTSWSKWGKIHGNEGLHLGPGPYFPTWNSYPIVPLYAAYNWDIRLHYPEEIDEAIRTRRAVIGKTDNLPYDNGGFEDFNAQTVQWVKGYSSPDEDPTEPLVVIYYPMLRRDPYTVKVDSDNGDEHELVGMFVLTIFWRHLIRDILPPGSDGISVVFSNECGQAFTYTLHGPNVTYEGGGDLHQTKYDSDVRQSLLAELQDFAIPDRRYSGLDLAKDFCPYTIRVYPSDEMQNEYISSDPVLFSCMAIAIFLFSSLVFLVYDHLTRARQHRILQSALKNSAVVSSLFPQSFRDRVLGNNSERTANDGTPQGRLQRFLRNNFSVRSESEAGSGPIAEYFEEATVMFADISNFTAWSSVREPGQVFSLLENIYGAFDSVAKRRGAYKVETIGDSVSIHWPIDLSITRGNQSPSSYTITCTCSSHQYVAVAGVPVPRPDHAIVMVRFARDCRQMMSYLTRDLEITLGPGTGDLQMRFGLNSGPVTAGVLRGERSRFQLFGDTVNTAACMEGTGIINKIHVTQATADLLIRDGKQHWVTRRKEAIQAKGKGMVQTYWVEPKQTDSMGSDDDDNRSASSESSSSMDSDGDEPTDDDKTGRLVDWNVDILSRLLRQVIANRDTKTTSRRISLKAPHFKFEIGEEGSILEEFSDVIDFVQPETKPVGPDAVELPEHVSEQLRMFVKHVAGFYEDHPFHNFEHACHVSMSLVKLVGRVVGPGEESSSNENTSFGLSCDPLAQFACIFAALVHDAQHPGVSNAQLLVEGSTLAQAYEFRSVAEQNSVDTIWELLNDDSFPDLRRAICATQGEVRRFRQLLVNLVLATDVLDVDHREARDQRWDKVFDVLPNGSGHHDNDPEVYSRKATILAEVLLQAADIGHTMQHWHIFRKWNEYLFEEMFVAHHNGRGDVNPAEYWYEAELAFFDDCVLPLARKLKTGRIFGVSSEEYYNYALRNREEWEDKGREVVSYMHDRLRSKYRSKARKSRGGRMESITE
eukprot:scaffold7295_cov167-Amphora_coffeaeformis.AAC.11